MITIKEELVGSAKLRRAIKLGGHEAVTLWLALKAYAASHPTDGFVPDDTIEDECERLAIQDPERALAALLQCGERRPDGSRGQGLVDPHDHGCVLHDYLDHALSGDELVERQMKDRERKRLQRDRARLRTLMMERGLSSVDAERNVRLLSHEEVTAGIAAHELLSRDTQCDGHNVSQEMSRDIPEESRDISPASARADGRTRTRAPARPSPAQPNPAPVVADGPLAPTTGGDTPPPRRGSLTTRLRSRGVDADGKPLPRHDPAFERIPFLTWFPSKEQMDWASSMGVSTRDFDATVTELRGRHGTGLPHDFDWWDTKFLRFLDVTIERGRKNTSTSTNEERPWTN